MSIPASNDNDLGDRIGLLERANRVRKPMRRLLPAATIMAVSMC